MNNTNIKSIIIKNKNKEKLLEISMLHMQYNIAYI